MTPLLGEVRMVYGLANYIPVDYSKSFYGQFDPTLLVQARKRIGQLKESWSSFTAGELSKAKPVQDQMALLIDSIGKLLPNTGHSLVGALNEVVDTTARQQKPPEATLGMEVATAILYLEATFEDFDPDDKQQSSRIGHLAQRVQMARGGAVSQPLESWMEELYRRVSDRQTMGSVVGELKLTLGELEKLMDAYFRDPQDKVLLSDVPGKLTQMRGVLTVLGLDQASQAVQRMRDSVEQILVTELDVERARAAGTFDKLGNNLGALGFLIDMLSYQPVLAKKLFVYDELEGELKPLMGRTITEEAQVAVPHTEEVEQDFNPEATLPLSAISTVNPIGADEAIASAPVATMQFVAPTSPSAPVVVDAAEVDPELLEIFLEEAREVAGNGLNATQALTIEPNNIGEMTTLRRAFHTLKGSSRMVGLNVFGEAAWSMEQVLNAWLADQKPASPELCQLSTQSLQVHQVWIEEIAVGGGKHRTAAPFRSSADAMRQNGKFVPLVIESVAEVISAPPLSDADMRMFEAASLIMPAPGSDLDAAMPEIDLQALSLPSFDLPDVVEPAPLIAEDFALHLDDLDQTRLSGHASSLLDPEPAVTLATQVVQPEASAQAAPIFDLESADFNFDVSLEVNESGLAAHDSPAADELRVTAADGSSVDLSFDMPSLSDPLQAPATELVSITSSSEQEALITADELAAFEHAMMDLSHSTATVNQLQPGLDMAAVELPALSASASLLAESNFEISALDLLSLQNLSDSAPVAVTSEVFNASATQPMQLADVPQPISASDLGIDLGVNFVEQAASAVTSQASSWRSDGAAVVATGGVAVAASVASLVATRATTNTSMPNTSMPNTGAYAVEEQFKAIGPLRVNLPLYNVYLNEADEWSRRLVNALAEWGMEPYATVPDDCVVFAHSLAGSSATIGFSALSGLARALENALLHMQRIEEDGGYDSHLHASLFVSAAEEIRHLLHQFAAGILKASSPQLEADLLECMQTPSSSAETTITDEAAGSTLTVDSIDLPESTAVFDVTSSAAEVASFDLPEIQAATSSLPTEPAAQSVEEVSAVAETQALTSATSEIFSSRVAVADPDTSSVVDITSFPDVVVTEVAPVMAAPEMMGDVPLAIVSASQTPQTSLNEVPVLAVRSRQIGQDEIDDEIDVEDALDPDLFEIFEEEAQEIFPATASALRQWAARPGNMSARSEVLRGLHTLKGSARLAGAMRLGELAHRMESSVETIPQEDAQTADIEALMAQLDGMQYNFDVLRNPVFAAAESTQSVKAESHLAPGDATSASMASVVPLRPMTAAAGMTAPTVTRASSGQTVRVRAQLLDRLMNQAGEVMITRARLEAELSQLRGSLTDLTGNLEKLRSQLRELDVQAESQMQTRIQQAKETEASFDPLEFDRYTRVQELTRMMAESVNDVATVQRNIQRTIESTEDDLVAQARQTRELQRDLLRTRMVEFEGISERLYRVVRQAGKDAGKQVKLDILGGTIEMDRGVLDRMTPAFEHLLRNCVAHGIETAEARTLVGKTASGEIVITLHQEGNDVSIEFRDDGAGLNIARIREKAISQGLLSHDATLADNDAANLIFTPGFSTAATVTELSGRGVGMDVVRSEVVALGGRIETSTSAGQGTSFKLVLPLTTAVTQVVMLRIGQLAIGVPANLIETVRRATQKELQTAYNSGTYEFAGESLPFFWAGALLQHSAASSEPATKTLPIAVFRSAAQRVVMHVDEVLGNQEVVVKNLGPQLSRLPGLAGMTVMTSGAVALIYNPVALATVYGQQARAMSFDPAQPHALESQSLSQSQMGGLQEVADAVPRELKGDALPVVPLVPANPASISPPAIPMVLVVDDSITVRRVTQRLLQREGYRVTMAADGLQALERLAEELPSVILSDIEMPRMDGFDLLRNVRGDAKLKHLPTIMITSRIAEKHREYAFELGANHYLGKPYNEEELLSLIRRYAREEATI